MQYINLRPRQLVEQRTRKPVAYLGLGILEWHGLHNPLGLDGVKANAILEYIADKLGGVVVPPLFWGDNRKEVCEIVFDEKILPYLPKGTGDHATKICEVMGLSRKRLEEEGERSVQNGGWRLWEELMVHIFFQLESLEFKVIIPYPGHYPLMPPLDNAIATYQQKGGTCRIFVLTDQAAFDTGDHAAKLETSMLLRLTPDLVDLNELEKGATVHLGVNGPDPLTTASYEYGDEVLQKLLEIVKKEIEGV